jgi:pimeloyl-ACP methyl ester carboxylesterase
MRRMQAGQPQMNLFEHDFGVCDRYANGLQAAAAVTCPVHFVLGSADQMTSPKVTREIAGALKARVHMLASGHCLMQEAPDGVLGALRAALA